MHVTPTAREERRHVAAAGSHLEHLVALLGGDFLEDPRLYLRLQHPFAFADRDLEIGEREGPVLRRHEFLPAHLVEKIQYRLIEHLPRPDLLLDHIEPRLLDVHNFMEKLPLSPY